MNFTPEGEVIEKGNYVAGIKNGSWTKLDRGILYEFIHDQNNTVTKIKTYYPSGNLKSIYTVFDSGKISEDFDEKGNRIKLNIRNFKGKLHGEYKTTYKGKTYIGYYLNGYKHGVFETYDEKGNLEATQNYEFGRIVKNPTLKENFAVCKCPQEFNIVNGSSFYNPLKSFISYSDFSLFFKELLSIPEKDYNSLYVKGFQNSYSRNNVSRFYGFDMNGGRFALQHPLLKNNDKPSSIYFNCKSLQVEDRIVFKQVSKACIEPNTTIKGTDFSIESIKGLIFNNESYGDNLELHFIGYIKGIRKSILFQLDVSRNEIFGIMDANQFSGNQLKKVLKQTKGELIDNNRSSDLKCTKTINHF